MRLIAIAALLAATVLAGCEPKADDTPAPIASPTPTGEPVAAFWDNYPPALQGFIDEDAAAGDCVALQEYFDVWDRADDPGNTKGDLLGYIDDAMRNAGCYG